MVDYKKVKEEIKGFNDIAELIRFAKLHYKKIARVDRAQVFNEVIQDRQKKSIY